MKQQELKKSRERKNKKKYKVKNWPKYNKGLIKRGSINIWISQRILNSWYQEHQGKPGRQRIYSDTAIETIIIISKVYSLPLRGAVGFVRSIFKEMNINLTIPDYTTLSRRMKTLETNIKVYSSTNSYIFITDSTGIKLYGEGEWKVKTHGKDMHRRWVKVHLGMDENLQIHASKVTKSSYHDSNALPDFLEDIQSNGKQNFNTFIGDGGYDTHFTYELLESKGFRDIKIPPKTGSKLKYPNKREDGTEYPRDKTVREVQASSIKEWKEKSGYYKRSIAEANMFRYKRLLSDKMSFRSFVSQENEVIISCSILNVMLNLAKPETYEVI